MVLEALAEADVPALVYVSCNPATLARDLSYLAGLGYEAGPIQSVDMFPWTSQLEI
jgi:23S rRNA (uracil1939-C5)-methyltransferase